MSLALIGCHVPIRGRIAIKKGNYKGKLVEPGQNGLAQLIERDILGAPKKYNNKTFFVSGFRELWNKTGIVSFMRIPSYAGGHIDLVDARNDWACRRHCYFDASEIWFWHIH